MIRCVCAGRARNPVCFSRASYTDLLRLSNDIAVVRARVVRQHARLHGLPAMEDNLCASRDCTTFFKSFKCSIDQREVQDKVARCQQGLSQIVESLTNQSSAAPHASSAGGGGGSKSSTSAAV